MHLDVKFASVRRGIGWQQDWRSWPAKFRVNLAVLEHARFHLARGRVRKKWCSVLRRLRRMALGEMARCGGGWAKRAGLGGGNSCRAGKRVQSYPGPT